MIKIKKGKKQAANFAKCLIIKITFYKNGNIHIIIKR